MDSLTKLTVRVASMNITEEKWNQIKDIQDKMWSNYENPLEELRKIWDTRWKLKLREIQKKDEVPDDWKIKEVFDDED
jgi:hypothetical protein